MRRATKEYKNKRQEMLDLKKVDLGLSVIHGRKFNETKIAALNAFLAKLKPFIK